MAYENDMNLKATELRLGLPGTTDESSFIKSNNKRSSDEMDNPRSIAPKAQVVGWPPVRSYRKNVLQQQQEKIFDSDALGMYVKVSMDGAPYLRKIDIKVCKNYPDLLMALENMFKCSMGVYSEREGYKQGRIYCGGSGVSCPHSPKGILLYTKVCFVFFVFAPNENQP